MNGEFTMGRLSGQGFCADNVDLLIGWVSTK